MDPNIGYALTQLRGISTKSLTQAGQHSTVDRIQRAIDALERSASADLPDTVLINEGDLELVVQPSEEDR